METNDEFVTDMIRRLVLAVERISLDIETLKDLAQAETESPSDDVDLWTPGMDERCADD